MGQKGTLCVISGNSGTGKSLLQNSILEIDETFEEVPKDKSGEQRPDDRAHAENFGVSPEEIRKRNKLVYLRNGNTYGINDTPILNIVNSGKNAIVIATSPIISTRLRWFCIDNDIPLLKVYMDDPTEEYTRIGDALLAKGRDVDEVASRNSTEYYHTKNGERKYCDFTIENGYDLESKTWLKTREELLAEFYTGFKEFARRRQEQEACYAKLTDANNVDGIRKTYLEERWLGGRSSLVEAMMWNGEKGYLTDIVSYQGKIADKAFVVRQLDKEIGLQEWLDEILMARVTSAIYGAAAYARNNIIENDMKLREELKSQYLKRRNEIDDPNNELVAQLYLGLINQVPLMPGETVASRMEALRYSRYEKTTELPRNIQRQLVEISIPYHNKV